MNLTKEFKGWNSCTKKQKLVYLEQFLHKANVTGLLTHDILNELVMVFWNYYHEEE